MKYLCPFLLFLYLFGAPLQVFSGGAKQNNKPDSNSAIVSNIYHTGNESSILAYKKDTSLMVDIFLYQPDKGSYSLRDDILTLRVNGIWIDGAYKIGIIERDILLFTNNKIYKIEVPIITNTNTYLFADEIVENVLNVLFFDNNCFYILETGRFFLYNTRNDLTHEYGVTLELGIESATIIKADVFAALAEEASKKWFEDFTQSLIANPGLDISANDELNLQRYFRIASISASQNFNTNRSSYQDIRTWKETYFANEYATYRNDLTKLIEEFVTDWNVAPSGNLFSSVTILDDILRSDISSMFSIQYSGKNRELIFLITFHDKLKETYQNLRRINNVSAESISLLESSYKTICTELSVRISEEIISFSIAVTRYNRLIEDKRIQFEKNIRDGLNSIDVTELKDSYFDYYLLSHPENDNKYVVFFKSIVFPVEVRGFLQIGQNINMIGIYDKFIYVCGDNTIIFYDPFTLIEIGSLSISNNEKVLFSIDQNKGIVITKNESRNEYNIRSISNNNRNQFVLQNIRPNPINNNNTNSQSYNAVFYATIINNDVYINSFKSRVTEALTIRSDYLYRETSTGSGIIIPRG